MNEGKKQLLEFTKIAIQVIQTGRTLGENVFFLHNLTKLNQFVSDNLFIKKKLESFTPLLKKSHFVSDILWFFSSVEVGSEM